MRFGLSFLATDRSQIPHELLTVDSCLEAVIFDRAALEPEMWKLVWSNVQHALRTVQPKQLTFHFPVNNCDYASDLFVQDRLREAFQRSLDLGLAGVVVHANNVSPVDEWRQRSVSDVRLATIAVLSQVVSHRRAGSTWLGLENMPAMDNHGDHIDPTFVFPQDFLPLRGTGIAVTWDICHFFNAIESCNLARLGLQPTDDFPNLQWVSRSAFREIKDLIVHWHFSAFQGVPDRRVGLRCKEGVLPWQGTLDQSVYRDALVEMLRCNVDSHCILEVFESDYTDRQNGKRMLDWVRSICGQNSNSPEEFDAL